MGKAKTALFLAVILLLLFWNPVTRSIMLYILPLGSGIDDLVFLALVFVVVVLAILSRMEGAKSRPPMKKQRLVFWSIIGVAVALMATVALVVWSMH